MTASPIHRVVAGWSALVLIGCLAVAAPSPALANGPDGNEIDPLHGVNERFRETYRKVRDQTQSRLDPLIVVRHSKLTLITGHERHEADVIPEGYHRLKEVAHVPLAVFVALAPWTDGPLNDDRLAELGRLRDDLHAVLGALETYDFTLEALPRQKELVDRSLAYLDVLATARTLDRSKLDQFTRQAAPLVLANAAEAAALQIDGYDRQLAEWRKTLTPEQWARLRVVVVGRQLPRKGNVAVQYFARRLGLEGEGPRLVYAEELSGDPAAVELMATHELDREIGRAFFGDPARMERDLLGDGAAEYLKQERFID